MNDVTFHAVYGAPPQQLVDVPADAVQLSPLMPGALALETCAEGSLASAVIAAPPGTLERRYVLAGVLQALALGAPLTVLALKDKGGTRIAEELRRFGCEVVESSRSHYRICTAMRPAVLSGIAEALDAGEMQLHAAQGLWTQPGIFSWDRLDAGSALLLAHLPLLAGNGVDFGCGLGVLSRAVLTSPQVSALTLMDIDRRAVEAAKRNIADPLAYHVWADVRQNNLADSSLDFVVMNPPFHEVGIEDKSLGQAFITQAARVLKPGGACWLTANRHLPYEALLQSCFRNVRRVAEADGFKIFVAEK